MARKKKCCNCGTVVAEYEPINKMGTSKVITVKPFVIKDGKFWCKECSDGREKREE